MSSVDDRILKSSEAKHNEVAQVKRAFEENHSHVCERHRTYKGIVQLLEIVRVADFA